MKKNVIKLWIVLFVLFSIGGLYADEVKKIKKGEEIKKSDVQLDGAELGKWTMDYDAGLKLAKEKKLPVFINFTGSDWCGWCKKMTKSVFSKKEWQDYAKKNLVLIIIDFPKDKIIVPEKYKKRNDKLSDKFGIKGYPTYIVLDDDGVTELGRLSADSKSTPKIFIKKLKKILLLRVSIQKKLIETLSPEKRLIYKNSKAKLKLVKGSIERLYSDYSEEKDRLYKEKYELSKIIRELELNSLSKTDKKRYLFLDRKLKEKVIMYKKDREDIKMIEKEMNTYVEKPIVKKKRRRRR